MRLSERRRARTDVDSPATPTSAAGAIDAWLDLLDTLLRVRADERGAITDELRDHLARRTMDLMFSGRDEVDAALCAIRELGDAASVARQYTRHDARLSRRRTMMTYSAFGLGAAATALSVTALTTSSSTHSLDHSPAETVVYDAPASIEAFAQGLAGRPFRDGEMALVDAFEAVREASEVKFAVVWPAFETEGVLRDEMLSIQARDAGEAFTVITESLRDLGLELDWRDGEGGPRLGTARYFDQREMRLAAYDLRPAFDSGVDMDQLRDAITAFVHPYYWADNGGDLARMQVVGDRLFIQAPERTHVMTQWIIAQVVGDAGEDHGAAANPFDPAQHQTTAAATTTWWARADGLSR